MENSIKIEQQTKVVKLYLQSFISIMCANFKDDYELATAYKEAKSQFNKLDRMVEATGILDIESVVL